MPSSRLRFTFNADEGVALVGATNANMSINAGWQYANQRSCLGTGDAVDAYRKPYIDCSVASGPGAPSAWYSTGPGRVCASVSANSRSPASE